MPKFQDQQAAMADIDAIASNQMGVEPRRPNQDSVQLQTELPPDQEPKPNSPAKPKEAAKTQDEKASSEGSPKTEGDQSMADAVVYEIEFGENDKRKLTPQQIKSTMERYSALNYEHAQNKPILELASKLREANPNAKPEQIAQYLAASIAASQKNATMGKGQKEPDASKRDATPGPDADDIEAQLAKWEDENAASLPPGYKDMIVGARQGQQSIQKQLEDTQKMLMAVLSRTEGVANAARDGSDKAAQQQVDAIKTQIGNNIDRSQAALQLPDDKVNDFLMFTAERGFTMEDFVDPQLTHRVMTDFKNNMDSGEMDRIRAIHQRRQAYTGSMGPSSSSGDVSGQPGGPGGESDRFAELSAGLIDKRLG